MIPRLAALGAALLAVGPGLPQSAPQPDSLTIAFHSQVADARTGEIVYSGGVTFTYGSTTITADRVTLWVDPTKLHMGGTPAAGLPYRTEGVAEGNVHIDDPDGAMTASRLEFDWVKHTGHATDIVLLSDRVVLHAATLDVDDAAWVFTGVSATTDPGPHPLYVLHARRLVIQPGKRAAARNPALDAFGRRILAVPFAQFSLDRRVTDLSPPTITIQEGGKVGLASDNSFLLNDRVSMSADVSTFKGEYLRYGAQLVYDLIPPSQATGLVAPRSELAERFAYGYFDDITTPSPAGERSYLGSARDSVSFGTFWNQRASSRLASGVLSKPWEAVYERGGEVGGLAVLGQFRLQHMELVHGVGRDRAVAQTSVELPSWTLGRGLATQTRLEGESFLSSDGAFGWGLAQVGVVYSPILDVRLGGAFVAGGEFGPATFEADRLYSKMGFAIRADWCRGPTKVGFLAKYDVAQGRWFDDEYSMSQIMGCIEPYVFWRRFPNQFSLGVSLRADEFIEKLQRRSFR